MESPSLILTSYQDVLSRAMDVVSNNVANSNTTGFKHEAVQFETLLSRPVQNETLSFVIDRATYRDTSMGVMTTTGNPLDLSIQGEGYFTIQTKNGVRYTRSGSFQLNADGEVVTANGDKMLGDGDQPIVIGSEVENINISGDGVLSGKSAGVLSQLGKLKVVKFKNEQELQSVGSGLYTTRQQPEAVADLRVAQGMLERSNVDSVSEMTRMIDVLRSYQQTSKMMDAETQRLTDGLARLARATA